MFELLAYFDPGSGSLLAQLLFGGAAGLIVLVRVFWEMRPRFLHWSKTSPTEKLPSGKSVSVP
ncbi:MAG: hypothetical protein JSS02_04170 [Planctomycetes bacterium]|nr:hypothetical protein [Planctomycetota bacterium]